MIRMLFFLLVTTLMGCAQHHCRRPPDGATPMPVAPDAEDPKMAKNERRVWVYKYDGSLQCNQGKPIAVETMAKELTGLKIFASEKRPDGLMHIQVCGAATGMANVFEILESDLPKAEKLGFKKWTFE